MIRPPIVGTVGRESGQVRLRVTKRTDGTTLRKHVQTFTRKRATSNTDEWQGYTRLQRKHATVAHGEHEWARDDDGDGIREVHVNTIEGTWTSARNYLRPFRGVHKRYLSEHIAMCEFDINLEPNIATVHFATRRLALGLYMSHSALMSGNANCAL